MLPIRRVASEFRELKWAQVLVELVLLILGILIALAVNDWIEDRRDARLERQYLEFLVRDLGSEQQRLADHAAFEEKQTQDGVQALRALRGEGSTSEEKLAAAGALSRLTTRSTLRLPRSTYQDLLGTGSLRLIRNPALRDQIVRHYGASETTEAIVDRNNQQFVDQLYVLSGLGSGLLAPPVDSNSKPVDDASKELARRVGGQSSVLRAELWALPTQSPPRAQLEGRLWFRTMASLVHTRLCASLSDDSRMLGQAITEELATRWSH